LWTSPSPGDSRPRRPTIANTFLLQPIGYVRSPLRSRQAAPRQGNEGAPNAWLELDQSVGPGLDRVALGQEMVLLTWLHEARRDVLHVHPRGDRTAPLHGVFATRAPDRPNPIGLHRVRVLARDGCRLEVGPLEALDGTPVLDLKPVLAEDEA